MNGLGKKSIASNMAITVIDGPEVVDIENADAEVVPLALEDCEFTSQRVFEAAAMKARERDIEQRVGEWHPLHVDAVAEPRRQMSAGSIEDCASGIGEEGAPKPDTGTVAPPLHGKEAEADGEAEQPHVLHQEPCVQQHMKIVAASGVPIATILCHKSGTRPHAEERTDYGCRRVRVLGIEKGRHWLWQAPAYPRGRPDNR